MFWRLHEPAHTTAVTAGRLLWVINRKAQIEHIWSAIFCESGRSHAARNAALASSRLSVSPPPAEERAQKVRWPLTGVLSGAPLPRYGQAGRCRGTHPRSPSTLPADPPARQWVRCFLVCREVEARSLALPCRYGFPISGGCRVREYCDGVLLMPCSPSRFCWVWNVAPGGLSTGACAVAIPAPASIAANVRSVRLRLPLIILFDMAISFLS